MDECWWRPFSKTGNTAVIHVDLTPHATRETNALAWLDKKEQARWQRHRHPRPRREFGLCRAALRAILCRQLGCNNDELAFDTSNYGKPVALVCGIPASISFNVSHSGKHGLLAFAPEGRIGVDVEERVTRHDLDGEIRTVFAPGERAELALAHGDRKVHLFFSLWTMKEALIKALGMGLSLDTSRFEIPLSMRHGMRTCLFRFPQLPEVNWRLENLGNADFAAAIAQEVNPVRP
jgi:4'-phosphopantetheinyl transferase